MPEVGYEVDRDEKEIVLSWPHPFTWEDYPITGYDIVCRETESEKIVDDVTLSDTIILNEPAVSHTVDLPPHIPDCYTLQCTVTASNALDQSNVSITDIYFPKSKHSVFMKKCCSHCPRVRCFSPIEMCIPLVMRVVL